MGMVRNTQTIEAEESREMLSLAGGEMKVSVGVSNPASSSTIRVFRPTGSDLVGGVVISGSRSGMREQPFTVARTSPGSVSLDNDTFVVTFMLSAAGRSYNATLSVTPAPRNGNRVTVEASGMWA